MANIYVHPFDDIGKWTIQTHAEPMKIPLNFKLNSYSTKNDVQKEILMWFKQQEAIARNEQRLENYSFRNICGWSREKCKKKCKTKFAQVTFICQFLPEHINALKLDLLFYSSCI